MSLRTTVADSPGVERVSSVINSSFLPNTPPALLRSSIANNVPLCEELPNAASLPVREANSPTGIELPSAPPPGLLQADKKNVSINAAAKETLLHQFFIIAFNSSNRLDI